MNITTKLMMIPTTPIRSYLSLELCLIILLIKGPNPNRIKLRKSSINTERIFCILLARRIEAINIALRLVGDTTSAFSFYEILMT